jgi:hypothetical protein
MFAGYNAILFFIYFAHFQGEQSIKTQSFWRYNTHLGFLFVLLATYGVTRYVGKNWPGIAQRWSKFINGRVVGISLAGLIAFAPFGFVGSLRSDMDGERPLLRESGQILARKLPDNSTLLLNIPAPYYMRAWEVAHFIRIQRQDVTYLIGRSPDETVRLINQAHDDPFFLWSICGSAELAEAIKVDQHQDESGLFMREGGQWSVVEKRPHPEFRKFRWNLQPTLPMCRGEIPYFSG